MLKRFPGPGVHAVLPETSISQKDDVSVALPGSRQLMPMMAMGSTGPWPAASELLPSCLLNTDHGVDVEKRDSSLPAVELLALVAVGLSLSGML